MKLANVVSKLTKAGFTIAETQPGSFRATKSGSVACIEWFRNGPESTEATCLRSRRVDDHDDMMTDHTAGSFHDTIVAAISTCENYDEWAAESAARKPVTH